jgi:hypothetical protein
MFLGEQTFAFLGLPGSRKADAKPKAPPGYEGILAGIRRGAKKT